MKAAIHILLAVVTVGATMSHAAQITLFNTGVDDTGAQLALGAPDPHWTIVSGPGISSPVQAVVVNQQHPYGRYTQSPFSLWIGVAPNGLGTGPYTLRLTFDLSGLDPTTAVITGQWAIDDGGSIRLNGRDSGIGTGTLSLTAGSLSVFNTFHSFTLNQGFLPRTNTLDFVMTNGDQATGLNVTSLSGICTVCTPHEAAATATVVNGFVVGATITDAGCGYTNAPLVLIQGGGGSGATATAVVSDGRVTAINIASTGVGYTTTPRIAIASPPFVPTLTISVSKVKVTQHVVLGRNYVLEASTDLVSWTATGPQFAADSETMVSEFDVDVTGRFFRIRQVP